MYVICNFTIFAETFTCYEKKKLVPGSIRTVPKRKSTLCRRRLVLVQPFLRFLLFLFTSVQSGRDRMVAAPSPAFHLSCFARTFGKATDDFDTCLQIIPPLHVISVENRSFGIIKSLETRCQVAEDRSEPRRRSSESRVVLTASLLRSMTWPTTSDGHAK